MTRRPISQDRPAYDRRVAGGRSPDSSELVVDAAGAFVNRVDRATGATKVLLTP